MKNDLVSRYPYTQLHKFSKCTYRPVLLAPGWVTTQDFKLQILATHTNVFQPTVPPLTNKTTANGHSCRA